MIRIVKKIFKIKILLVIGLLLVLGFFVTRYVQENYLQDIQEVPLVPSEDEEIVPAPIEDVKIGDNAQTYSKSFSPNDGFADLVSFASPSVVNITAIKIVQTQGSDIPLEAVDPAFRDLFKNLLPKQAPKKQRFVGLGTGFVIRSDGFILTNYHVIQESENIQVTFDNGDKYGATIFAVDEMTDLALLKVDGKNLPTLKLGDSDASRAGDWVIAIGNPYGLGGTVSLGIISAKSRDINLGGYADYLQTDAAINKGNSGGPMINTKGEVIGINTAIFSNTGGSIGIGFALPSNTIKIIVSQLITNKKVVRSWLGVQIQGVDDNIAKALNLDNTNGALVSSVVPDSPAFIAGVKAGDVVIAVNGEMLKNSRVLPKIISNMSPNTKVILTVISNKEKKEIEVILQSSPVNTKAEDAKKNQAKADSNLEKIKEKSYDGVGLKVAEINPAIRKYFNFADDVSGVVILGVKEGSIVQQKGLAGGLKIVEINQQKIENIEQLDKIFNAKVDTWLFLLEAVNSGRYYIPITKKELEQGYPD